MCSVVHAFGGDWLHVTMIAYLDNIFIIEWKQNTYDIFPVHITVAPQIQCVQVYRHGSWKITDRNDFKFCSQFLVIVVVLTSSNDDTKRKHFLCGKLL